MNRILLLLCAFFLASCSKTVEIQLEPEVNLYTFGESEQKATLTADDEAYNVLNKWLREYQSEWNSTSGRYPGGVYVQSGEYGVQVTKTHVILYSIRHGEPQAIYIQKVHTGELSVVRDRGRSDSEQIATD